MTSELLCTATPYVETYPSASASSLESRAHQIFAADGGGSRGQKRTWNQHNSQVQAPALHQKTEDSEKKDKLREVACQICGKRITMRRCNLRHHAAVVHSGIERYACRCGYSTVHRNTIIRHMLKHSGIEEEKHYEFTDMLTPAEAERIEHLTEECFREYRTVPRGNEENDDLTRTLEGIVSGASVSARDEEPEERAGMSP
uniref:C2H2-type domain-containing protein n=1 Tax=Angiostrongylus cantonensis TaxID=6313 RepID=A0A158P9G4_ANGCA